MHRAADERKSRFADFDFFSLVFCVQWAQFNSQSDLLRRRTAAVREFRMLHTHRRIEHDVLKFPVILSLWPIFAENELTRGSSQLF